MNCNGFCPLSMNMDGTWWSPVAKRRPFLDGNSLSPSPVASCCRSEHLRVPHRLCQGLTSKHSCLNITLRRCCRTSLPIIIKHCYCFCRSRGGGGGSGVWTQKVKLNQGSWKRVRIYNMCFPVALLQLLTKQYFAPFELKKHLQPNMSMKNREWAKVVTMLYSSIAAS